MADYKEIDEARKMLGLEEFATLEEIKEAYRKLSRQYHPDQCRDDKRKCEEMFKKVNSANQIIMAYCAGYKYSFREKDVKRNIISKAYYKHLKKFYDGWWGDLDL